MTSAEREPTAPRPEGSGPWSRPGEEHSRENGARADDASSDALGHFWKAAHELLLAARTVIDAADSLVEEQLHGKSGEHHEPRVRRIDVDER